MYTCMWNSREMSPATRWREHGHQRMLFLFPSFLPFFLPSPSFKGFDIPTPLPLFFTSTHPYPYRVPTSLSSPLFPLPLSLSPSPVSFLIIVCRWCMREPKLSDKWQVTCDMWHVTSNWWQVTCDMWHVTCGKWQVTSDTWQVTCDKWQVTRGKWQVTSYKRQGTCNWSHNVCGVARNPKVFKFLLMKGIGEEVRRWGGEEVKRWASEEVRKWGSEEVRKWGSEEVRKWGSEEVRKWGSEEVRKWGSEEVRRWGEEVWSVCLFSLRIKRWMTIVAAMLKHKGRTNASFSGGNTWPHWICWGLCSPFVSPSLSLFSFHPSSPTLPHPPLTVARRRFWICERITRSLCGAPTVGRWPYSTNTRGQERRAEEKEKEEGGPQTRL